VESHVYLTIAVFGVVSAIIFSGAGVAVAKGIGKPGLETICTSVTFILVLLSKPLLIARFGAMGSVISSSASWCLGSALFLTLVHRRVPLPPQVAWRTLAVFMVTLLLSGGGWWLTEQLPFGGMSRPGAALRLLLLVPPLSGVYLLAVVAVGALDLSPVWQAICSQPQSKSPPQPVVTVARRA
jgi:hypothetical protein